MCLHAAQHSACGSPAWLHLRSTSHVGYTLHRLYCYDTRISQARLLCTSNAGCLVVGNLWCTHHTVHLLAELGRQLGVSLNGTGATWQMSCCASCWCASCSGHVMQKTKHTPALHSFSCLQPICNMHATFVRTACNNAVQPSALVMPHEQRRVQLCQLQRFMKATGDLTTSWIAGVSHTSRHNSCHSQARHCQGPEAALPGAASPPHALGSSCSEPVATTSDYLMDSHRTSVDAAQQMSVHASGRSLCQGSTVSR